MDLCPNGHLTENVFKRIFANSNPTLNSNSNPNTKTGKEMTSFFGQVFRYRLT